MADASHYTMAVRLAHESAVQGEAGQDEGARYLLDAAQVHATLAVQQAVTALTAELAAQWARSDG